MALTVPGALEGLKTVQSVPFTMERAWEVSTCGWPTMGVQYTVSRDWDSRQVGIRRRRRARRVSIAAVRRGERGALLGGG
jgi:hypothetical protein